MTALPLELLSFPRRPTISPCQQASSANGFSVKDVRARAPGAEEGQWASGKEPLISALIAIQWGLWSVSRDWCLVKGLVKLALVYLAPELP